MAEEHHTCQRSVTDDVLEVVSSREVQAAPRLYDQHTLLQHLHGAHGAESQWAEGWGLP